MWMGSKQAPRVSPINCMSNLTTVSAVHRCLPVLLLTSSLCAHPLSFWDLLGTGAAQAFSWCSCVGPATWGSLPSALQCVRQMEKKREAKLCPDNQWGLGPMASLCSSCFTNWSCPVYLVSSVPTSPLSMTFYPLQPSLVNVG